MMAHRSQALRPSGMTVLQALYGLGVWASCFVVLYGGLSIGCTTPLARYSFGPTNGLTALLLALWLAHLGVLTVMTARAWRALRPRRGAAVHAQDPARRFMQRLALFLHATAWIATVAIGLPIWVLLPCV